MLLLVVAAKMMFLSWWNAWACTGLQEEGAINCGWPARQAATVGIRHLQHTFKKCVNADCEKGTYMTLLVVTGALDHGWLYASEA